MQWKIKPELHQLLTFIKTSKKLPSITNLVTILNTTENKIRTLQKDLLHFKFIYAKSSSGYAINEWTKQLLDFNFNITITDDSYLFTTQTKSFMRINKKMFYDVFKFDLSLTDIITSIDVLYIFIILSKVLKSIHTNTIEIVDNKCVLSIDIKHYKTDKQICFLSLFFDRSISWNS